MKKSWKDIKVGDYVVHGISKLKVLEVGASGTTFFASVADDYDKPGGWWLVAAWEKKGSASLEGKAEKWKPEMNEKYFIPHIYAKALFIAYEWQDTAYDQRCLSHGLVCCTEEEAIAMAQKILDAVK